MGQSAYAFMKLTVEECALIMDNCFANLFVTDNTGRIVYANKYSSKILGLSVERLLEMSVYDLHGQGFVSHSYTDDVLRTKKQVTGSYYNKDGKEVACVCTPVFNPDGSLRLAVTYSQEMGNLGAFMQEIQNQKEEIQNYRKAIKYLDDSKNPGARSLPGIRLRCMCWNF